jgi:hypothetical protein
MCLLCDSARTELAEFQVESDVIMADISHYIHSPSGSTWFRDGLGKKVIRYTYHQWSIYDIRQVRSVQSWFTAYDVWIDSQSSKMMIVTRDELMSDFVKDKDHTLYVSIFDIDTDSEEFTTSTELYEYYKTKQHVVKFRQLYTPQTHLHLPPVIV